MKTLKDLKQDLLADLDTCAEYDALAEHYARARVLGGKAVEGC